jgi:hypothetical protein
LVLKSRSRAQAPASPQAATISQTQSSAIRSALEETGAAWIKISANLEGNLANAVEPCLGWRQLVVFAISVPACSSGSRIGRERLRRVTGNFQPAIVTRKRSSLPSLNHSHRRVCNGAQRA